MPRVINFMSLIYCSHLYRIQRAHYFQISYSTKKRNVFPDTRIVYIKAFISVTNKYMDINRYIYVYMCVRTDLHPQKLDIKLL